MPPCRCLPCLSQIFNKKAEMNAKQPMPHDKNNDQLLVVHVICSVCGASPVAVWAGSRRMHEAACRYCRRRPSSGHHRSADAAIGLPQLRRGHLSLQQSLLPGRHGRRIFR